MRDNYEGQRLVTLTMIDNLHQVQDGSASKSFRENKEQFVEDEDFFSGDSGECLFTESGYAKIIWPFDDDLSWQVHRELVNSYMQSRETAREVQTVEQFSHMLHNDPATLLAALRNY